MPDQSHLDLEYFIDDEIYNCAFCNRRRVSYTVESVFSFDWSDAKKCLVALVACNSCRKHHCTSLIRKIYWPKDQTGNSLADSSTTVTLTRKSLTQFRLISLLSITAYQW